MPEYRVTSFYGPEETPQEQAMWTYTNDIPEMVFGFIFSLNRKLAWANKHNISPNRPRVYRAEDAFKEIGRRLPAAFRRVALVHDAKSPVSCLVICSNRTEAELAKARDPDILRIYHDVVGIERTPRWYPMIS
ncbi:hypothetical protein HYPSUDRAFT_69758 [Hypholoma sublateritium FD-334 SS-4]|uniref:Uncharacterized protein n=1 Tax=Hypholoma sublateritium (strain FD-334 SS-4) TaxID=945553 RepID=A0A0D2KVQ9_HYPSF|nr:hypothetical protein HYPSUDRAFT_69758 [Hypholoma sublateritium FD-334 SS-4]